VPSEKRERKRAARQAKQAALEKQKRRRAAVRRGITIAVVVGVVVLIVVLVRGGSSKKSNASSTSTTAPSNKAQAAVDAVAVRAGCPSNPHTALTKTQWKQPPAITIDPAKNYDVTVRTDVGTFTIALDPKTSLVATNNFVFLADHDFYNCVIFHRVIPGFVVQGGDPTGTGTGGPGYEFTATGPPKAANPADQYPLGSVAMANSSPTSASTTSPNTNGSQFFIVTGSSGEMLTPNYVLFGQVVSGMAVVNKIDEDGTSSGTPAVIHRMLSVSVSET
jgi:cyclophilin family peptidyl-prolyl cis-trans isomerase